MKFHTALSVTVTLFAWLCVSPMPAENQIEKLRKKAEKATGLSGDNAADWWKETTGRALDQIKSDLRKIRKHYEDMDIKNATRPVDQMSPPKGHENRKPDVILYYDKECDGDAVPIYLSEQFKDFRKIPCKDGTANFNDRLSSLRIRENVKLVLYEDIDFGGKPKEFKGKQTIDLIDPNDFFSSCRVLEND